MLHNIDIQIQDLPATYARKIQIKEDNGITINKPQSTVMYNIKMPQHQHKKTEPLKIHQNRTKIRTCSKHVVNIQS